MESVEWSDREGEKRDNWMERCILMEAVVGRWRRQREGRIGSWRYVGVYGLVRGVRGCQREEKREVFADMR